MQDKADEKPAGPFSIISVQLTCWFRNHHNFERKEIATMFFGTRHHRDQYHLDFHHNEIATMVKPDEKMRWCCKNADWYHHDAFSCWFLSMTIEIDDVNAVNDDNEGNEGWQVVTGNWQWWIWQWPYNDQWWRSFENYQTILPSVTGSEMIIKIAVWPNTLPIICPARPNADREL